MEGLLLLLTSLYLSPPRPPLPARRGRLDGLLTHPAHRGSFTHIQSGPNGPEGQLGTTIWTLLGFRMRGGGTGSQERQGEGGKPSRPPPPIGMMAKGGPASVGFGTPTASHAGIDGRLRVVLG